MSREVHSSSQQPSSQRRPVILRISPYISATLARAVLCVGLACLGLLAGLAPAASSTADLVRQRGKVVCGVHEEAAGYSTKDAKGEWSGLGIEYCKALAVAVLGRSDAVEFAALKRDKRLEALRIGAVDVIASDVAITASGDTSQGVRFPVAIAYEGQGFLVRRAQGISSALELSGTRVCVAALDGDDQGALDYFAGLKIPIEIMKLAQWSDAVQAYEQKSCQVLSGNVSRLAAARAGMQAASEHLMLPELAVRHAIGPVVRQGDEPWFGIVRWTAFALFASEGLGITSANADQLKGSAVPEVRRLLSGGAELCTSLGLPAGWVQKVVRNVGNYGELYERSLGARSPLRLERQLNNLVGKGGLHFAPSFR